MLETTLSTDFIPGTNLKGHVAGANWVFLLPTLHLERVICIGAPSHTTLTTLASFSQDLVVACPDARTVQRATQAGEAADVAAQLLTIGDEAILPLPDRCADLVLITGGRTLRWLRRHPALRAEVERLLQPEGLLYYEYTGPLDPLGTDHLTQVLADAGAPQRFWLTPFGGEMHTAVPLADQSTIRYFLRRRLYSPTIDLPLLKRAWRAIRPRRQTSAAPVRVGTPPRRGSAKPVQTPRAALRSTAKRIGTQLLRTVGAAEGLISPFIRRHGVLRGRTATALNAHPPRYLRQIAQREGVDLDRFRWGLVARGDYSSRKLLFFLFERTAAGAATGQSRREPTYVVKMVRDPRFNARLENECRALRLLQEHGIGTDETLPRVVFAGHHADLALVGETALAGVPFQQRTHATADCPYAGAAVAWLTELGAATATTAAAPNQLAETLETLFQQFTAIYTLSPGHRAFLADQIAAVRYSSTPIPLVFQHGDPGTWNMLVTPSGGVALLDWEAAEPQGMPLWDLFYFLRSYAVGAARAQGVRHSLTGFTQQLLRKTPLRQRLLDATECYRARVGLADDVVAPLFYTCWLHRALKEATRLPPAHLERGHYVNLLRLCIDQHATLSSFWRSR